MKIASFVTRRDMEIAAELRAAGATWETIAKKLGRQRVVVTRWTTWYSDDWNRLIEDAEERWARNGSAESRAIIRLLLRDTSPRIRLCTAETLVRRRLAEKAAEPSINPRTDLRAFMALLEKAPDADLERSIDEFLRRKQAEADAAV